MAEMRVDHVQRVGLVALAAAVLAAASSKGADANYTAEVQAWRQKREAGLKADGGWLTVAGLFWLKEGPNRFGSGARVLRSRCSGRG